VNALKFSLNVRATPEEVYRALTIPLSIQLWTGEAAEMSTEPGSEFSMYNGNICGKNIDFEEDKKIVQEWYFGEQGEESIVTYLIHPTKKGSCLEVRQTNIPDEVFEEFKIGWRDEFLEDLKEFFHE